MLHVRKHISYEQDLFIRNVFPNT